MKNRKKIERLYVNGREPLRRIVINNLVEGGANVSDIQ